MHILESATVIIYNRIEIVYKQTDVAFFSLSRFFFLYLILYYFSGSGLL